MKTLSAIFSYVVAFVFLLSGLSKLTDVLSFQNLIAQYGFPFLHFTAPFIVLAEITLGMTMLLRIDLRLSSILAVILLVLFSAAYTYGHLAHGVNDCGCFGNLIKTDNAVIVLVRNIVLVLMSFVVFHYNSAENGNDMPSWKRSILLTVLFPSVFLSGMTSRIFPNRNYDNPYKDKSLYETSLSNYAVPHKKRELVLFMSYSCNHCINSIENYKSYIENKAVDTALCYVVINKEKPELDSLRFGFKQNFPDIVISETEDDINFVTAYPTAFYIENDTIKKVIVGELPSPFVTI